MTFSVVLAPAAADWGIFDQSQFMESAPPGEGLDSRLGSLVATQTSWGDSGLEIGGTGTVTLSYSSGFVLEMSVVRDNAVAAQLTGLDLYSPLHQVLLAYTGSIGLLAATFTDTLSDDVLLSGNDTITGNDSDNTLEGYGGGDTIDGGAGLDTAVYSGSHSDYLVVGGADVTVTRPEETTDHLTSVERLQFDDGMLAFDFQGTAGQAYRLYQAAFNRAPDVGGLGYQINDLDHHYSLVQVAWNFIASPEFQSTYGSVDDTQFLTLLYQNVLHRAPDAGGLQFHLDEMHVQGESRALELVHFSESPENQANVMGAISQGIFYDPFVG